MKTAKLRSARRKRLINNTAVHVVLAVLAFIWVFPILWVILTSFRAEKGSYVSTFLPQSFTLDNYTRLFTDTTILNFPQMFANIYCHLFMYPFQFLCAGRVLLSVTSEI